MFMRIIFDHPKRIDVYSLFKNASWSSFIFLIFISLFYKERIYIIVFKGMFHVKSLIKMVLYFEI